MWAIGPTVGAPRVATYAATYARALVELCVRIWLNLEDLAGLCERGGNPNAATSLSLHAATLRLEFVVLSDACDSALWRSLLDEAQRQNLRSILIDVLGAIDLAPDALTRRAIELAQDRLFDEVLIQYTAALHGIDFIPLRTDWRSDGCLRSEPVAAVK
jgi:hypothetical protein